MIIFRLTRQAFVKNSFITRKSTPISKTLNSFGYIKNLDKRGNAIVIWYDNYVKSELTFKKGELLKDCKSIYPYYNGKFVRGNIWKHSYETLLSKICKERGFTQMKVDQIPYKMRVNKGTRVEISSAKVVLKNNITELKGKVLDISKDNVYTIRTREKKLFLQRNDFCALPQDYFILLSVRCN